jgi:hypothetical protein
MSRLIIATKCALLLWCELYPEPLRHLRHKSSWLQSVYKWGLECFTGLEGKMEMQQWEQNCFRR